MDKKRVKIAASEFMLKQDEVNPSACAAARRIRAKIMDGKTFDNRVTIDDFYFKSEAAAERALPDGRN